METALTKLLEHGVLGIAVVVLGLVIRTLWQQNNKFIAERDGLHTAYQVQYNALVERYVAEAKAWAEKNREMASTQASVLEALLRRRGGQDD